MAEYAPVNFNIFARRQQESQARPTGGGGFARWKPKAALLGKGALRNVVRMMPPHVNMLVKYDDGTEGHDPIVGTKIHYNLGPQAKTACPCLEPYGEKCPACEWTDDLFGRARREPDPDKAQQTKDMAFSIRAKYQFFCNLVDMAKPEDGVQRWAFGPDVEKKLRACFLDDQQPPQLRDITSPERGRDIIIEVSSKPGRKGGNDTFPNYDVIRCVDHESALQDDAWLDAIHDLTDEVYHPTLQQVLNALQGIQVDRKAQPALAAGAPPLALQAPQQPATNPVPTPQAAVQPAYNQVPASQVVQPPAPAGPPPAQPASGRRSAPRAANAPTPGAPTATAPIVAPVASSASRQAVGDPPAPSARQAVGEATDPIERGTAEILRLGFATPKPYVKAALLKGLPGCYGRETDPAHPTCQGCGAIRPCMAVLRGWLAPTEFPD